MKTNALLELLPFRRKRLSPEDYLARLTARGLTPDGNLVPDSVPIAPPIGYIKQPSLAELMRNMVLSTNLQNDLAAAGHETEEEANDFDIGDESDPLYSGYENDLDHPVSTALAEIDALQSRAVAQETADKAELAELRKNKKSGGGGGTPPSESPPTQPDESPAPAKPPKK
nr:MAG: hypothetical protein [Microvirus sp.]